jgi:hypothetical protein
MKIIKANGEESSYDPEKIIRSLERAGASEDVIQKVLTETEKELFEGIHTKAMYKIVFRNLKRLSSTAASRYHLKQAIMELGPTGFPFEKFIAALMEGEGYQTRTDQIVQGHCIKHEVDIIAEKDSKVYMVECKFHALAGNICDVKQALYVYARFLDIEKFWTNKPEQAQQFQRGLLVTNTRLSTDAEKYGRCVGLGLLSWNYPKEDSLRERIDRKGLYPITCLTTLSKNEKQRLLNNKVVLCRTLCTDPLELTGIGLTKERKSKVLEEVRMICENAPQEL